MFENEFMNPSERLTAFLDGELTQEEAGTLFYELAQNPELQDEMRQLVTIRNTFRNSMLIPPDYLKSKVFKKAGFSNSSMSGLSKSAAALVGLFYSRSAVTAVAILTLGILSYVMISSNWGIVKPNENTAVKTPHINIPVISSTEKSDDTYQNKYKTTKTESQIANAVVINKNKKANNLNGNTGNFFEPEPSNSLENENSISALDFASKYEKYSEPTLMQVDDVTNSLMLSNEGLFVNLSRYNNKLNGFNSIDLHRFLEKVNFEFKEFQGISPPSFDLAKNNSSLLNNFSIGINYMLNDHHSLGLAVGFENFMMSFDKYDGDILYTYKQSYNSEWLAVTYQYSFDELKAINIRPVLNLLAGATKVGPVFKISGGGSYYFTDNFAIMGGVEFGWLFYPNETNWSNGQWFSTNKIGFLVGLKVGL
jgi:hypothetical protein